MMRGRHLDCQNEIVIKYDLLNNEKVNCQLESLAVDKTPDEMTR